MSSQSAPTPGSSRDLADAPATVGIPVAAGVILLARYLIGPTAWVHDSVDETLIVVALVGAVVALAVRFSMRALPLLAQVGLTTVLTILLYASVPIALFLASTDASARRAASLATNWTTLVSQDYAHPGFFLGDPYSWECNTGESQLRSGRLVMVVSACRDFTYQAALSRQPPSVADFLLEADVEVLEGIGDSYCAVLFRYTDSEHWYSLKLGQGTYQVTHNPGSLPHRAVTDVTVSDDVKVGEPNHLMIFAQGSLVQFFVNGHEIVERDIQLFDGQVWLAAQAAQTSSELECAFDNIELRVPPSGAAASS